MAGKTGRHRLAAAAVAMIWLAWPQHVPARQRRLATAACVAVLAVIFVFQSRSMGAVSTTTQENARLVAAGFEETAPLYAYFATSIREFSAYYLWRLFVPLKLSVDPQVTVADGLISPSVLLSALLLAFAAAAAFHYRKRLPLISAGVALILISPLSAYCLFPLADVVAEHRAYITALGGVIVFAAGFFDCPGRL